MTTTLKLILIPSLAFSTSGCFIFGAIAERQEEARRAEQQQKEDEAIAAKKAAVEKEETERATRECTIGSTVYPQCVRYRSEKVKLDTRERQNAAECFDEAIHGKGQPYRSAAPFYVAVALQQSSTDGQALSTEAKECVAMTDQVSGGKFLQELELGRRLAEFETSALKAAAAKCPAADRPTLARNERGYQLVFTGKPPGAHVVFFSGKDPEDIQTTMYCSGEVDLKDKTGAVFHNPPKNVSAERHKACIAHCVKEEYTYICRYEPYETGGNCKRACDASCARTE
jgi:hypothetical protein